MIAMTIISSTMVKPNSLRRIFYQSEYFVPSGAVSVLLV